MAKYLDNEGLKIYTAKMKQYIDFRIGMEVHGKTNCPNCGAVIRGHDKCEYCGTDFVIWLSQQK